MARGREVSVIDLASGKQTRLPANDGKVLDLLWWSDEAAVAAAQADPTDESKLMAYARALAANGHHAEAIETLLHPVKPRGEHRDDARSQLLELFTVLGDDDPLVRDARPRLASALF